MIFCPSAAGDSPGLTPKAARIALAVSRLAPLARSRSSNVSPWRSFASRSRPKSSARILGGARNAGDVLRHHAHFDRRERRVRTRPSRSSRKRARPADRRRRGWCASAASAAPEPAAPRRRSARFTQSLTCACASLEVNSPLTSAASRSAMSRLVKPDLGVVRRRLLVLRDVLPFAAPALLSLSGSNGGTASAKRGRRRRQGRRKQGEGARLQHLLVADLHRHRRLEGLLGGHDVDRTHQPIALAGIDALLLRRLRDAAAASRIPAPRRTSIGDRGRDRASSRSARRRSGR